MEDGGEFGSQSAGYANISHTDCLLADFTSLVIKIY